MIVVGDDRGYRIEIVAQLVDGAWNAGVRIRCTLSDEEQHVEQLACRKPTAVEAEDRATIWARRWIDLNGAAVEASTPLHVG